jgi:signal transduction histidine kinase/ligand-binding sensor domain-containing protein/CheY-like chemotaxis protein
MKKYLLILLFALVSLYGSAGDFLFRHYFVDDGLPSNTVRAILQDKFGFIWFGTDEGLCRYDGTAIRKFCFNCESADPYVSCLYDAGDKIWVGSFRGILLYDYTTEHFTPLRAKTSHGVKISSNVTRITRDKDGNIWVSTMEQGAFRYSPRLHKLDNYPLRQISGKVACVFVDGDNQIWATSNWGTPAVWKLDKARNQFMPAHLTGYPADNYMSLTMNEDAAGNVWLGTWEHGLMKIDRSGRAETCLAGAMHIHSISEYLPGQLLIGCDDGLLLYNTATGLCQVYTEEDANPLCISNRFVYPIVKDREGGIWIGTFYGGVNYVAPNAGRFVGYTFSKEHNSVNGNVINRFCEDGDGNIWIASDDGGLNRLSVKTGLFTNYMPQKGANSLSYHNVHALCIDGGNLWIGTYTGGINVLDIHSGRFRHYNFNENNTRTPDGTSCYAIYKDRSGLIWATSMDGINLYDRKSDSFVRVKKLNSLTIDIDQDTKGNLWFSTQGNGLFRYNPNSKTWKHYLHSGNKNTLVDNQVNCTSIDSNGQMWVATMGGLCRYIPSKDCLERVKLDIPSQNINCIIEDDHVLWLTTSNGLVRYSPGEPCRVFTKSDGLLNDQFMPNAGLKASDGRIFVGTVNGFNAFYPYQIKTNRLAPKVYITGLDIFNRNVAVGSEKLPQALNVIKELNLSYKDNVFSLKFASLSYCTPEKNQYAYRLEGFDKQWNYVGSQNTATYTNLSPGTYIFHVKATNNDGLWSSEEATLKIVIHPPFYWSLPSKIIYFLLLALAVFYTLRYFQRRSEKRHAAVIRQLNEKNEIEVRNAKINFFTMIAHEIRTPVTLIIGPLENIMKPASSIPAAIREDLDVIDRNAHRLLYLVNQLLDFRKVEQNNLTMKFAAQNINALMHSVSERFEPSITQQGAKFEVEYPDERFTAIVDSEAITKLISNLLTNARKYTKDWVKLSCKVAPDEEHFMITVSDNGIGIRKEDLKKIFQPFFQAKENKPGTGIGLSIVKNITDLHHGQIHVESELGKGSSFIVTLPVKQSEVVVNDTDESRTIISDVQMIPQQSLVDDTRAEEKDMMLIVDDNQDMVNFISNHFKARYRVVTAEDGIEALEKLKVNQVSMIVSDWMMPRMDGIELCKAVRADANTSHIPFIMLTAKTDDDSKVQGMDCGADAYIEKPFSMQYLEACIKNMLEMRRKLRDKFSSQPLEPLIHIASTPVDNEFLSRMNKLIEDNFANPDLSVNFLADQLCISRSGLFAKIKMLADITPNEMIQVVRLKRAASLLADGHYQINEICYMVGFNNPSYFSKCFQKQFGMKPGEFADKA